MSAPSSVGHPLARWLRARVLALRADTRRRNFPGCVELVTADAPPGAEPASRWDYDTEETDHGLRVDVLVSLMTDCTIRERAALTLVHVRRGHHEPSDADLGWASAAVVAAAISGVELTSTVIVSRWGWLDVRTGASQTWVRPRPSDTAVG
ncbi:MAG: hypothetical protein ACRDOY_02950 [Nocardioidaceae bacterium]